MGDGNRHENRMHAAGWQAGDVGGGGAAGVGDGDGGVEQGFGAAVLDDDFELGIRFFRAGRDDVVRGDRRVENPGRVCICHAVERG